MKVPALMLVCALAAACASDPASKQQDGFDQAGPDKQPSAQTLRSMARLLAAQGRNEDCERALERLIEQHPDFAPAYNDLAELHMRCGRREEAVAALSIGLTHAPQDPVLLNNLGMCELQRGSPERAIEQFSAAVAASPGDARYRANMALALGLAGRLDESLALYLQVVTEADAHDNLAVVCDARGEAQRAAQERALAAEIRARGDL